MGRKKIVDVKKAKEALGEDKINDIISKEWKTAELPSTEDLNKQQSESPMARNNINSRKNLIQYRKDKPKEIKEAIINGLTYESIREDFDIDSFFGELFTPQMKDIFVPMRDALSDRDEEEVFFGTIKLFISDFPKGELSNSDLDEIANLALNRILELRLLKEAKHFPKRIIDITASIERFRKNSEKIKVGLASRRTDRFDSKQKTGFSIVDLAVQFDEEKKKELELKAKEIQNNISSYIENKEGHLLGDRDKSK